MTESNNADSDSERERRRKEREEHREGLVDQYVNDAHSRTAYDSTTGKAKRT